MCIKKWSLIAEINISGNTRFIAWALLPVRVQVSSSPPLNVMELLQFSSPASWGQSHYTNTFIESNSLPSSLHGLQRLQMEWGSDLLFKAHILLTCTQPAVRILHYMGFLAFPIAVWDRITYKLLQLACFKTGLATKPTGSYQANQWILKVWQLISKRWGFSLAVSY